MTMPEAGQQQSLATAHLLHDGESMAFEVTSRSGHTILLDASDGHGGRRLGAGPMEAVLMALAGCTGMDVISILRKARQDITDYRIEVHGLRADEHPRVYTEVEVVHIVSGHDLNESAVRRAVELSSTKYCPVSAMLAWGALVSHRFELISAD